MNDYKEGMSSENCNIFECCHAPGSGKFDRISLLATRLMYIKTYHALWRGRAHWILHSDELFKMLAWLKFKAYQ